MEDLAIFVDVVLPLSIPNLFTYRVPRDKVDSIAIGKRVLVQFGKKKIYTAVVKNIHSIAPSSYEAKYILHILDDFPIVNSNQLLLWQWISDYYLCSIGEVMNAALPSGLKLSSETKILLNKTQQDQELSDDEYLIKEALEINEVLTIQEVERILNTTNIYGVVKSLITKQVIVAEEEVKSKYTPKLISYVKLHDSIINEDKLKKLFEELEKRAFKQVQLLMTFLKLSEYHSDQPLEVKKSDLLKEGNFSITTFNELIKKNVFTVYEKETSRLLDSRNQLEVSSILSVQQNEALVAVKNQFKEKDVVLLHGVTSSGKTEIYIKLIEEVLSRGEQALYLLPEIALTAQIINRLKKHFGNRVGVYHSKYSENERVEVWKRLDRNNNQLEQYQVVLGARSALFLPFDKLGIIIIDEEHDSSYKQYDPSPRYNARDTAIYLAHINKAKVLLGSATPAFETFFNSEQKKYGYVSLTKRYDNVLMPNIVLADLKEDTKKKKMKSHFSSALFEAMERALKNKEQIILFQNRRGFVPVIECGTCGWTQQCKNCDVTLTYHKKNNLLRCHYCGYSLAPPSRCSACGEQKLTNLGFGTEKIEEELKVYFPQARIARMDLDTTRTKNFYQQIIQQFEERAIDILVGTQMVTKGLDFDHVSLVGVLNADNMLSYPDFRSFERSFQLMAQVSGRAGRKKKQGNVVIQTYHTQHPVITCVLKNDYHSLYITQMKERMQFHYPPYYRLIKLVVKHKSQELLDKAANELTKKLKLSFGDRILGPESPMVSRVKNTYLKQILIKIEREASITHSKQLIQQCIHDFKSMKGFVSVVVQADVDPL